LTTLLLNNPISAESLINVKQKNDGAKCNANNLELAVTYLKVLSQHSSPGTEKEHGNPFRITGRQANFRMRDFPKHKSAQSRSLQLTQAYPEKHKTSSQNTTNKMRRFTIYLFL